MVGPSLATQRKNKPTSVPVGTVAEETSLLAASVPLSSNHGGHSAISMATADVPVATVYRRFCGTSPFDKHWLNLDCCGLFCAGLTYLLHLYGCWVVCKALIPPWMAYEDPQGIRRVSGYLCVDFRAESTSNISKLYSWLVSF